MKRVKSYFQLVKMRMTLFIILSVFMGYFYARPDWNGLHLTFTLLGSGLLAFSCFAINQALEHNLDKKMPRTQNRPLPTGSLSLFEAWLIGFISFFFGTWFLYRYTNGLATFFGVSIVLSYCLVYTPLKQISSLNTLLGAIPGALPPLVGWAAVQNSVGAGGLIMFLILFFWQLPHFLAIAWLYREDYSLGAFQMLSVTDPTGESCFRQILYQSVLLMLVSIVPFFLGMAGVFYLIIALLAGSFFIYKGVVLWKSKSNDDARSVFYFSLIYLPCVLLSLILDRTF